MNELLIHAKTQVNLKADKKVYILCDSIYIKFQKNANVNRMTEDQWLPRNERGKTGKEGGIRKEHKETFDSDGYVHYLDGSDGVIDVFICQNLSNCTL